MLPILTTGIILTGILLRNVISSKGNGREIGFSSPRLNRNNYTLRDGSLDVGMGILIGVAFSRLHCCFLDCSGLGHHLFYPLAYHFSNA